MNVVSYAEAARITGVSRQAIYSLKKINTEQEGRYPFFIFHPNTGKAGIDIEHTDFLDYLKRNQGHRARAGQEKERSKQAKSKVSKDESGNSVAFQALIESCTESVQELFSPSDNDMENLNNLIMEKFGEKME